MAKPEAAFDRTERATEAEMRRWIEEALSQGSCAKASP